MAKKSENWKLQLKEQRELRSQGALLIRQRVGLLITIGDDKDFQDWCESNGKNSLDELDAELDDVGFDFLTLKAVYEQVTSEEAWRKTSLRLLVAEVLGATKRERTKESISWKERCLSAEKECERLRSTNDVLTARVTELEKVIRLLAGDRTLAEVA